MAAQPNESAPALAVAAYTEEVAARHRPLRNEQVKVVRRQLRSPSQSEGNAEPQSIAGAARHESGVAAHLSQAGGSVPRALSKPRFRTSPHGEVQWWPERMLCLQNAEAAQLWRSMPLYSEHILETSLRDAMDESLNGKSSCGMPA